MARKPRLMEQYRSELLPELTRQFSYKCPMAVPRLRKIIVNMGVGEAKENIKVLDAAAEELGLIAGQKAAITRARKSVANFKIRAGMPIGSSVSPINSSSPRWPPERLRRSWA
jgi:large subunit ribosomal protein L5